MGTDPIFSDLAPFLLRVPPDQQYRSLYSL